MDGRHIGLMKGFTIGFEAGFVEAAVVYLKEAALKSENQILTGHIVKKHEELLKRTRDLPNTNMPSTDFEAEVKSIRTLYKLCGSTLGPCPPNINEINSLHSNNEITTTSMDLNSSSKPPPSFDW